MLLQTFEKWAFRALVLSSFLPALPPSFLPSFRRPLGVHFLLGIKHTEGLGVAWILRTDSFNFLFGVSLF